MNINISGEVVRTSQLPKRIIGLGDYLVALNSSPLETSTVLVSDFVSFLNTQFATSLASLTDVSINGPLVGQALVYDGSRWVNQGIGELDTLNSVTTRGNTTTNNITVGTLYFGNASHYLVTDNSTYAMLSSNRTLQLATSGNPVLSVFTSQNVGIGTTTDSGFKLDVNGTARVQGVLTQTNGGTSSITLDAANLKISLGRSGNFYNVISTPSVGSFVFINDNSGIEKFRITDGRQIYTEQVVNGFNQTSTLQITGNRYGVSTTLSAIEFNTYTASGSGYFAVRMQMFNGENGKVVIQPSGGNVLIGTTTDAGYKLDVNGDIRSQGVIRLINPAYINGGYIAHTANSTLVLGGGPLGGENITIGPSNRIFIFAQQSRFTGGSVQIASTLTLGNSGNASVNSMLLMQGSITASSTLARGIAMDTTLVAAANNDVLVGLDINPTFTNGAFTGVANYALRTTNSTVALFDSILYSQAGASGSNTSFSITGTAGSNYTVDSSRNLIFNTGQSMYFNTDTDGGSAADRAWYFGGARSTITGGRTYVAITTDGSGFPSLTIYNNDNGPRIQLNSNAASYFNGGNLLVGTSTDAGYKLDVSGTFRTLVGTETNPFRLEHTNGNYMTMVVGAGSALAAGQFGMYFNGSPMWSWNGAVFRLHGNTISTASNPSTLVVQGGYGGSTVGISIRLSSNTPNQGQWTATTGAQITVEVGNHSNETWAPSSGNASYTLLSIAPRINTSGTYAGIVRGFYYNPTLTSVTGTTHRAIETTSGDVIFNGGQVGIGTTSPTGRNGYGGGTLVEIVNNTAYASLNINGGNISAPTYLTFGAQNSGADIRVNNKSLQFTINSIDALKIATTGNVLINTVTDAGYKLDVNGIARTTSLVVANYLTIDNSALGGNTTFSFSGTSPFISVPNYALNIGTTSNAGTYNTGVVQIWNQSNLNNLLVLYNGVAPASEVLRVTNGGNVGIGTTTPAYPLDVNGAGRIQSYFGVGTLSTISGTPTATPSTSGGTLADGTYFYKIVALDRNGSTTTGSTEVSATITGGGGLGSISLSWTAVTLAGSYRVYRGTATGAQTVYYSVSTNSYTDTGASSTAGTVPTINSTSINFDNPTSINGTLIQSTGSARNSNVLQLRSPVGLIAGVDGSGFFYTGDLNAYHIKFGSNTLDVYNYTNPNANPLRLQSTSVNNLDLVAGGGNVYIGSPTVAARLAVKGSGSTSATSSLLIQNSSGTQLFRITDDGTINTSYSAPINCNFALTVMYDITCRGVFGNSGPLQMRGASAGNGTGSMVDVLYYGSPASGSIGTSLKISSAPLQSGVHIGLNFNGDYTSSVGSNTLIGYNFAPTNYSTATLRAFQSAVGGVYVNTTSYQASAILQADSTTQGFLPPRLTTAQILAITSPAEGLQVYNTDLKTICFYNGTAWQRVTSTAM